MSKKVTIYSTPTCPYCIRTKKFLEDNNIVFENIDISSDRKKAEEMVKKSGQMGVPEKQIIVAAGEGAKAALAVFRYLAQQG